MSITKEEKENKYLKIVLTSWKIFRIFLITVVAVAIGIQINFLWIFGSMPGVEDLENPKSEQATEVYSADNVLLGKYFRENRSPVDYEQISPNVINALIATEDNRFHEHSGIDLKASFAIVYYMLKGDQRGSSTITQQLAKNLYKTRGQSSKGLLGYIPGVNILIAKIKEWITAIKLESNFTKEEILLMYLNTVDFGSNAYGIKVAAETFYATSPDSLKIEQAATLIGLLKATTLYSPIINPENSKERRNTVLSLMAEAGHISASEVDSLKTLPLALTYNVENQNQGNATYFRGAITGYLQEWCKANGKDLYADGLRVYTTVDSRMQNYAEEAVEKQMKDLQRKFKEHWKGKNPWVYENKKEIPNFLEDAIKRTDTYKQLKTKFGEGHDSIKIILNRPVKMKIFTWDGEKDTMLSPMDSLRHYKHFLHAGFMSMDPFTGQIKAWVGGINYKYFKYDHVKQGRRQPGSAFKMFVYAAAMDKGMGPCRLVKDEPITFIYKENEEKKTWSPKNSDWIFTGDSLTLRQAMARSVNTCAAQVMKMVGINTVIKYAQRLGIRSPLKPVPSICLGSSDVSVYEMTGAYSAVVNHGLWIEPYFVSRIEDQNGNVLHEFRPKTFQALSPETAYVMVHMLKGGTEERGGTSQALFQYDIFRGNEVGGKTGTTSNHSDGWYMGITRNHVAGMWVGGEHRAIHFRTSALGEGSKTALPIFGMYMEKVYADTSISLDRGYFKRPKQLKVNLICPYRPEPELPDSNLVPLEEES